MHWWVSEIKNDIQIFIYKGTVSCGKPCGPAKLHSTLWYSSAYLSGAHAELRCINITHVVPASPHRSFTWSNAHQVLSDAPATFCMSVNFISVCLPILLFSSFLPHILQLPPSLSPTNLGSCCIYCWMEDESWSFWVLREEIYEFLGTIHWKCLNCNSFFFLLFHFVLFRAGSVFGKRRMLWLLPSLKASEEMSQSDQDLSIAVILHLIFCKSRSTLNSSKS